MDINKLSNFTSSSDNSTSTTVANVTGTKSLAVLNNLSTTLTVYLYMLIAIGAPGTLANLSVLIGMLFYGETRKNTTNVFIFSQTVMDTVPCIATLIYVILYLMNAYTRSAGPLGWVLCLMFQSGSIVITGSYAAQAGLVVITVERYYLIVRPLEHRLHFKAWMIRAGVILPWINAILICIVPIWSTTRLVGPGLCLTFYSPISYGAYLIFVLVWQFFIPVCIFIFCYWKMLAAVRQQAIKVGIKPSGTQQQPSSEQVLKTVNIVHGSNGSLGLPTEETSRKEPTSSSAAAAAIGHHHDITSTQHHQSSKPKLSKSDIKIVRTMVIVVACYVVCWYPLAIILTIRTMQPTTFLSPVSNTVFLSLSLLSYVNFIVNPVIYSTHLGLIRRFGRALLRRINGELIDNTPGSLTAGGKNAISMATFASRSGKP